MSGADEDVNMEGPNASTSGHPGPGSPHGPGPVPPHDHGSHGPRTKKRKTFEYAEPDPYAGDKKSFKDRLQTNFIKDTEPNKVTKLEAVSFAVCLLAEKILEMDASDQDMPVFTQFAKYVNCAENLYGAIQAALQVVNTKGKRQNAKGQDIKITMNVIDKDMKAVEVNISLDYYAVWTKIMSELGFSAAEKGTLKIINEVVACEQLYKDLSDICKSQQTGAAKHQLGNEQFYPHFLCSGKKGPTMAGLAEYGGFMAVLNECCRIKKAVSMGKTTAGETEAMCNYMRQVLKQRLPAGQGWIVDTIVSNSGSKDAGVVASLKSNLGSYFGRVPPKRKLPELPPLFILYCATLLDKEPISQSKDKDTGEILDRSHRIFNTALQKLANVRLLFLNYNHVMTDTIVAPFKVEEMFIHYSGLTFGNLAIANAYIDKDIYFQGCLTQGGYTGDLGKMGKLKVYERIGKEGYQMVWTELIESQNFGLIVKNFKRGVKTAAVPRNAVSSLPVDLSGDAECDYMLAQPTQTIDQSVSTAEFQAKILGIVNQTSAFKEQKGLVKVEDDIRGIFANFNPRKLGNVRDYSEFGYWEMIGLKSEEVKKMTREEQNTLALAMSFIYEGMVEDGSFQDKANLKRSIMDSEGKIQIPDDIQAKMLKLEKKFKKSRAKAQRKAGYDGSEDVDF